jgi:hypothetical protein
VKKRGMNGMEMGKIEEEKKGLKIKEKEKI